jgi:hypothetical protein
VTGFVVAGSRPPVVALLRRGNLRIDAVLVVDDRQLRAELRGPVERLAEERDELRVVGQAE